MNAILKRNRTMSVDDLTQLTEGELRQVSKYNWLIFNLFAVLNLMVFYHSLYAENWLLLFISLGLFVSCLAVYDNYKVSSRVLREQQEA